MLNSAFLCHTPNSMHRFKSLSNMFAGIYFCGKFIVPKMRIFGRQYRVVQCMIIVIAVGLVPKLVVKPMSVMCSMSRLMPTYKAWICCSRNVVTFWFDMLCHLGSSWLMNFTNPRWMLMCKFKFSTAHKRANFAMHLFLFALPPPNFFTKSSIVLCDTGGEDRAGPPQRDTVHWAELDVKRIQLQQGDGSLYTPSTLRGENRAQKHINNPHVQGARKQDKQHDAGHPNSPTIHQVHASLCPWTWFQLRFSSPSFFQTITMSVRICERFLRIFWVHQIIYILHMFDTSRARRTIPLFGLHTIWFLISIWTCKAYKLSKWIPPLVFWSFYSGIYPPEHWNVAAPICNVPWWPLSHVSHFFLRVPSSRPTISPPILGIPYKYIYHLHTCTRSSPILSQMQLPWRL